MNRAQRKALDHLPIKTQQFATLSSDLFVEAEFMIGKTFA
jgi:hypothetical protein